MVGSKKDDELRVLGAEGRADVTEQIVMSFVVDIANNDVTKKVGR